MRALASALVVLMTAARVHAQPASAETSPSSTDPPSSNEASLLSGRTLDSGESMIGAALGWPGFWVQVELAPSDTVSVGVRGAVVYGSPVMSLAAGAGGELTIPVRLHLAREGVLDVSLRIAPAAALGEGRLFGGGNTGYGNRLGVSGRVELGVLISIRPVERFTMFFGVHGAPGFSYLETERVRPIGVFYGALGVEALMSLETMLFAELQGGFGVADGSGLTFALYPEREILRLSLGMAYVL